MEMLFHCWRAGLGEIHHRRRWGACCQECRTPGLPTAPPGAVRVSPPPRARSSTSPRRTPLPSCRDIRLAAEAQAAAAAAIREGLETWDPTKDPNVQGDPFKTLFVGRLSYDTSERKLRRELEEFGPIRRIRIVHDRNTGKPRGYAFVEFEHKNDMKQAYKLAEGRKVEDRRILVDVERGRAVTGW